MHSTHAVMGHQRLGPILGLCCRAKLLLAVGTDPVVQRVVLRVNRRVGVLIRLLQAMAILSSSGGVLGPMILVGERMVSVAGCVQSSGRLQRLFTLLQ